MSGRRAAGGEWRRAGCGAEGVGQECGRTSMKPLLTKKWLSIRAKASANPGSSARAMYLGSTLNLEVDISQTDWAHSHAFGQRSPNHHLSFPTAID